MLTKVEIQALYDRAGIRQERSSFYHDATARELLSRVSLRGAESVVEFGCGTGRFAEQLLHSHLPPTATYLGLDISPVMVDLARSRLAAHDSRVRVERTDGAVRLPVSDASQDAVFSNYVLDLLSESDIDRFLSEAARVLRPRGLLCLTGLGSGAKPGPRLVSLGWSLVHRLRPGLVGGCGPLSMAARLTRSSWRLRYSALHDCWCVPSEVIVGEHQAAA